MEPFYRAELRQVGDEYEVILYVDQSSVNYSEEFSGELGAFVKDRTEELREQALQYIKKQFPKVRIATVSIMAGATLLSAFPAQKAQAHEANFAMSYLYFGNTATYLAQIAKTQGNLSLVSPSYFDLNEDGSLQLTKQLDPVFIEEMHKQGKKVVPFISNHWDRALGQTALANREQLATQVAEAIVKYNLDGVNVDIENVTETDRDNYTDFVRLLREKLPEGKEVSVAVAANPNSWTKGWHGSYDYQGLAKYADYLMIMAYDESYPGSAPGPVASYDWVERSIQYAINQGVTQEQIVLGIPFYGRYWMEGSTSGGIGISNAKIMQMVKQYNGQVTFDEASKSPKATITIKPGDPTTTVGGKVLQPGTYQIWFENEQSLQAKMNLIHQYNLKGTGSWSLGQEDVAIWNQYRTWMTVHQPQAPVPVAGEQAASSYVVMTGDTLSAIALKVGLTVEQLKTYNSLTSDKIYVGKKLRLTPPEAVAVTASVAPAPSPPTVAAPKPAAPTTVAPKPTPPAPATTAPKPAPPTAVKPAPPKPKAPAAVKPPAPRKNDVILKMGQRGASVTTLQQNLQKLGAYSGKADGVYGKGTQTALLAFQKKNGLPQTGNYDTFTKEKMDALLKAKPAAPKAVTYPTVQSGSKGSHVTQLQQDLKKVGLYKGKIDGVFNAGTKTALTQFQKKYKVPVTGKGDATTQAKMNQVLGRK